ncbi:MAG: RNA polymerase sigma factor [Bacilli bacterium]|nr:RNA polymerase sigma factor [Bacilli bacterium]MDD4077495.1 RNA polymerase sigma factor [Bacilli bacterium]MDD4387989.1 RNA polymerase sigma factor [Bacilli bacterium]
MHKNEDLEEIIEQFKKEDYSRFDQFYKLTNRQIYFTIIAVLKDQSLAEDVMQDTYLKILKYILSYQAGTNPLAWMMMIARNTAINVYNRRKRETLIDPTEKIIVEKPEEEKDTETPLIDLMNKVLKPKEKELIVLHVINGLTHKEIAKLLKRPLGTVLWQYNRAINKLREKVGEENEKQ